MKREEHRRQKENEGEEDEYEVKEDYEDVQKVKMKEEEGNKVLVIYSVELNFVMK